MSPRSRSCSPTSRRSYSRSLDRRSHRRYRYASRSASRCRNPPSPPPLPPGRYGSRHPKDSRRRSLSRSASPRYSRHKVTRRRDSSSCSRFRVRSRSRSHSSYDKHKRERPSPSRCLGVFGLSVHTTQLKIREIFSKYGPIDKIQVVTDAQTGYSRGFCFIYYKNLEDASVARDNCCGLEIDGRRIRVAYSITQRPHTPTPGRYKGQNTKKLLRERYHREQHRPYSPSPPHSNSSNRRRYERSRSRSHSRSSRRYRY